MRGNYVIALTDRDGTEIYKAVISDTGFEDWKIPFSAPQTEDFCRAIEQAVAEHEAHREFNISTEIPM
jgi:hypothetical protein